MRQHGRAPAAGDGGGGDRGREGNGRDCGGSNEGEGFELHGGHGCRESQLQNEKRACGNEKLESVVMNGEVRETVEEMFLFFCFVLERKKIIFL